MSQNDGQGVEGGNVRVREFWHMPCERYPVLADIFSQHLESWGL